MYGAGVFGLSVAWACQSRGARVRVIDPHGVAAGASGGIVGALAPHVPENWNAKKAFQLDSLLMAGDFWREIAEISGLDPGYARHGRLQPIEDGPALERALARAEGARALWRGAAEWRVVPAPAGNDPWQPAGAGGHLIHDTLSARVHPRRACTALATALTARGAEILPDGAATGLVLWATGAAGLARLSDETGRAAGSAIKGQAALFQLDRAGAPQLYADGLHVVPHADGTVAVGSTSERTFASPDGTDALLDDVIARARHAVAALRDAPVIARWAGLRPRARSRAPMLGAHPLRQGHFIANGGFKIGFGMAPKVAEVMARLMLDGVDDIPEGFEVRASL